MTADRSALLDDTPNRDQAELWNSQSGRTWAELNDILDALLRSPGEVVVQAAVAAGGLRLLDIGCGAGDTTFMAARALGSDARCLGVDISGPLIETARRRAAQDGAAGIDFLQADAQVHPFDEGAFDTVISRFGVMFFDDPTAAFTNLRRAVRPGGHLAFVAWRGPGENSFMTTAQQAAAPLLPPMPPRDPDAPGQFAFADETRVRAVLQGAGWTGVDLKAVDLVCALPKHDLPTYVTRMGPVGMVFPTLDEDAQRRLSEALVKAFQSFLEGDQVIFTAACWLATARN